MKRDTGRKMKRYRQKDEETQAERKMKENRKEDEGIQKGRCRNSDMKMKEYRIKIKEYRK
jgi:hypothetical protein